MNIFGIDCYITLKVFSSTSYYIEIKWDDVLHSKRRQLVYKIGKELNILKSNKNYLYANWNKFKINGLIFSSNTVLMFPVFKSIESAKNFISMINSKFLIQIR